MKPVESEPSEPSSGGLACLALLVCRVSEKRPGGRKLSELVANHVFSDVDGDELLTVVNRERQTQEIGHDDRASAPRLDDAPSASVSRNGDLGDEVLVNERPLLD